MPAEAANLSKSATVPQSLQKGKNRNKNNKEEEIECPCGTGKPCAGQTVTVLRFWLQKNKIDTRNIKKKSFTIVAFGSSRRGGLGGAGGLGSGGGGEGVKEGGFDQE